MTEAKHRLLEVLAEHWIIAVAFGLMIAFCLWLLHPFAPIQIVTQIGADTIGERAAAYGSSLTGWASQPIVYVTIDDSTLESWGAQSWRQTRPRIAALTSAARRSGAKVVVLDVEFSLGDPAVSDETALAPLFEGEGAPLILAVPLERQFDQGAENWTYQFSPSRNYPAQPHRGTSYNFTVIPSDVIRSVPLGAWVFDEVAHNYVMMPSISAAAVQALHDQGVTEVNPDKLLTAKSDASPPDVPIRFFIPPTQENPFTATPWPWFRVISASQVEQATSALKGAVVIIGQDNTLASDHHMTPLGVMSGALVHANAIASMLHFGLSPRDNSVWDLCLEIALVLAAATLSLPYWWAVTRLHRWGDRHGLRSRQAGIAFVADVILLTVTAVIIFNLAALTVLIVGAKALLSGAAFGNLAAILGVALETLVSVGHKLYGWLHWAAKRFCTKS